MWIRLNDSKGAVNLDYVKAITVEVDHNPGYRTFTRFWFTKPYNIENGDYIECPGIPDEVKGMLGIKGDTP